MKYAIFTMFMALICSCSTSHSNKFNYNQSENVWVDAFKDQVFFTCLRESYKDDSIFNLIEKKDAFNSYDDLNSEAIEIAIYNGERIIKNIPPPAMCENCSDGENYYMATCLHYYKSKELDSIAKAEYKKHLKLNQ